MNETRGRGPAEFETVLTSAPAATASFEEEHTGGCAGKKRDGGKRRGHTHARVRCKFATLH